MSSNNGSFAGTKANRPPQSGEKPRGPVSADPELLAEGVVPGHGEVRGSAEEGATIGGPANPSQDQGDRDEDVTGRQMTYEEAEDNQGINVIVSR